ncbi:hypothetical protein [Zooshikella ganghwensis]|uniref:hypothetical protein n=1 Tax=Zooshikella ganghwensis TaxID=202772 RepID=UPI0013FDA719|nr:hypothetical protein [Zooshikella ganghwensis]
MNQFTVSIFCATKEAATIEQKLTEDFMSYWYAEITHLKANQQEQSTLEENGTEAKT